MRKQAALSKVASERASLSKVARESNPGNRWRNEVLPSSMQSVCGKVAVGENTKISIPRGMYLSLELIIKK